MKSRNLGHNLKVQFTFFGLYLPHKPGLRSAILQQISSAQVSCPSDCVGVRFMLGDFNFVAAVEDTTSASAVATPSSKLWKEFSELIAVHGFSEFYQEAHTFHRRSTDQATGRIRRVASRLDRIYGCLPEALTELWQAVVDIPALPFQAHRDWDRRLATDHLPVRCRFFPLLAAHTSQGRRLPSCPRWVLATPEFPSCFEAMWAQTESLDPAAKLHAFKRCVRKACSEASRRATARLQAPPLTITHGRKLLQLLSSQDEQCKDKVQQLLAKAPSWNPFIQYNPVSGRYRYEGLVRQLSLLYRRSADPQAMVNAARDLPEGYACFSPELGGPSKNSFGVFRSSTWRPKRGVHPLRRLARSLPSTRASLTYLVSGLDHTPTSDPDQMAEIAHSFWGGVWADPFHDPDATREWLRGYQKRISKDAMVPRATPEIMERIILNTNNSAAGPDGIPFGAFRVLAPVAAVVLSDLINAIGRGQSGPPEHFNACLLHLLPKKQTGKIEDTRPISIPNASNRLISIFFTRELTRALDGVLDPSQRAGLPGRQISENIYEVNEWYSSRAATLQPGYLVFIDFKKAFDSMSRSYLLALLEKIGCPRFYLRLYAALLHQVHATLMLGGKAFGPPIPSRVGIKQGGPASPIIFCLGMDPLLTRCSALVSPPTGVTSAISRELTGVTGGFMDDVSAGLPDIRLLPDLAHLFNRFGKASGLRVNLKKTMLVPTRPLTTEDRRVISASPWPDLPVKQSAAYLGVQMGIGVTVEDIFNSALRKFEKRVALYLPRKFSYSVGKRVVIANTMLTPIFSYLAQFYLIPESVLKRIMAGLRQWLIPLGQSAYPVPILSKPLEDLGLPTPLLLPEDMNLGVLLKLWPRAMGTGIHRSNRSTRILCQVQSARHVLRAKGVSLRLLAQERGPILSKDIRAAIHGGRVSKSSSLARIAYRLHKSGLPVVPRRVLAAWRALPTKGNSSVRFHFFSFLQNALAVKTRRLAAILRRKKYPVAPYWPDEQCSFCNDYPETREHIFSDCLAVRRALWICGVALKAGWVKDLTWHHFHLILPDAVTSKSLSRKATTVVSMVAAVWRALMRSWVLPLEQRGVVSSAGLIVRHFWDVLHDCGPRWTKVVTGGLHLHDVHPSCPPASKRLVFQCPPSLPAVLADLSSSTSDPRPSDTDHSTTSTDNDSEPTGGPRWHYKALLNKRLTKEALAHQRSLPFGRRRSKRRRGQCYEFQVLWHTGEVTWEPFSCFAPGDPTVQAFLHRRPPRPPRPPPRRQPPVPASPRTPPGPPPSPLIKFNKRSRKPFVPSWVRAAQASLLQEAKAGRLRRPPDAPPSSFNTLFNYFKKI